MTELCAPAPDERGTPSKSPIRWTIGISASLHLALLVLLYIFRPIFTLPEPSAAESSVAVVFSNDLDNPGQTQQATPAPPQQSAPRVNLSPDDMQEEEVAPPAPSIMPLPPPRPHVAPHKQARNSNPFANMPIYSLGPSSPQARPARGQPTATGLDLATGPITRNGEQLNPDLHLSNPNVSPGWADGLMKWIEDRAYYPQQAIERNEDGESVIQVVFLRDGTVKSVRLISSSGSRWLDLATQSIFQGQKVPALPADFPGKEEVLTFDQHFILIHSDFIK